jgi:ribose-phosphate pyrophosphokinase
MSRKRIAQIIACPGARFFAFEIEKALNSIRLNGHIVNCDFPIFANGETKCVINEPLRGSDVFIIQDVANTSTGSVNDNIATLLTAIDSANHASAQEVTVIIPTFPYSRQHKKSKREGLTASLWCHVLENLGVKRIITLDIHSREIQNSFNKTIMENLHASYEILDTMKKSGISLQNLVVVAPDSGAIERNKFFALNLKVPLAMIYKERDYSILTRDANNSNIMSIQLIGDVNGSDILMVDDMIDSGGTILKSARHLRSSTKVKNIYIACSLPFFNAGAIQLFEQAVAEGIISGVFGTNAVYNPVLWQHEWFKRADVHKLFAKVIYNLNNDLSISSILESSDKIVNLI